MYQWNACTGSCSKDKESLYWDGEPAKQINAQANRQISGESFQILMTHSDQIIGITSICSAAL